MVERVSCVCGGSVNRAFLALLSELENLVVGLFAIGFFEKLFWSSCSLSFMPSGILLSALDHLCDVLLELCLVGGLIAKERVDGLSYHIL